MGASEEEGTGTGKLKPGLRTIAGVITEETYAALLALRRERGIPTMSKTVGEALREWAEMRSGVGFKPRPAVEVSTETSERSPGLKPGDAPITAVQPWAEVRGLVRDVTKDGPRLRVALEDRGEVIAVILQSPPRGPPIQVGMTVAILRTDETDREYVVRTLD